MRSWVALVALGTALAAPWIYLRYRRGDRASFAAEVAYETSGIRCALTIDGLNQPLAVHWDRAVRESIELEPVEGARLELLPDGLRLHPETDSVRVTWKYAAADIPPLLWHWETGGLAPATVLFPDLSPTPGRWDGLSRREGSSGWPKDDAPLRPYQSGHVLLGSPRQVLDHSWRGIELSVASDPSEALPKKWLGAVLSAIEESLTSLPGAKPLEACYVRNVDSAYSHVIEPVSAPLVIGSASWEPEDAKRMGLLAFWDALQGDQPLAIAQEARWLVYGAAELTSEHIAHAILAESPFDRAPSDWRRRRWEYVSAHFLLNYAIQDGPSEPADALDWRGWKRFYAPLALEEMAAVAGEDLDDVCREVFGKALDGSLNGWQSLSFSTDPRLQEWARAHVERPTVFFPNVDWPTDAAESPLGAGRELAILLTERTKGYLESCGCAVSDAGGAAKRIALIKHLRETEDHLLVGDLGSLLPAKREGESQDLHAHETWLMKQLFGEPYYDLLVPAPEDLMNGGDPMQAWLSDPRFVSANLEVNGEVSMARYKIFQQGGANVLVVGVTDYEDRFTAYEVEEFARIRNRYRIRNQVDAVRQTLAAAAAEVSFQTIVVAGQISPLLALEMAQAIPTIDLILSSNTATLKFAGDSVSLSETGPTNIFQKELGFRIGRTRAVFCSAQTYGATLLRLSIGEAGDIVGLEREYLPLPSTAHDDEGTRALIDAYYEAVVDFADWHPKPLFPHNGASGGGYVGSQACEACHSLEYLSWRTSRHGQAFNTLLSVRRQFVPKCVQCHVVGLGEPTGYHPGSPSRLLDVGCEVCHGGGAYHVEAPTKANIRRPMDPQACRACHDSEHSPDFEPEAYLHEVRHW